MNALARLRDRYRVSADPLRTERRVELAVVALATVLLLQLVWAGTRMLLAGDVAPMTPAADSLIVAEVPRPQSVDAEDSAAVQARPLFWAERRPLEVVASTPAEDEPAEKNERAAPKMKNVTLLGVFGSGRTGGAIVAVKGSRNASPWASACRTGDCRKSRPTARCLSAAGRAMSASCCRG